MTRYYIKPSDIYINNYDILLNITLYVVSEMFLTIFHRFHNKYFFNQNSKYTDDNNNVLLNY